MEYGTRTTTIKTTSNSSSRRTRTIRRTMSRRRSRSIIRSRRRSRSQSWTLNLSGAGKVKNGRLRQPYKKENTLLYTYLDV